MALTWWDIECCFVVIVFGSFTVAFIESWLEQRRRDKKNRR